MDIFRKTLISYSLQDRAGGSFFLLETNVRCYFVVCHHTSPVHFQHICLSLDPYGWWCVPDADGFFLCIRLTLVHIVYSYPLAYNQLLRAVA